MSKVFQMLCFKFINLNRQMHLSFTKDRESGKEKLPGKSVLTKIQHTIFSAI